MIKDLKGLGFELTEKKAQAAAESVVRQYQKDVAVSTPNLGAACRLAKRDLATAKKKWEDAGSPREGRVFTDYLKAQIIEFALCSPLTS